MLPLTTQELARATEALPGDAERFVDHLNDAMLRFDITTPERVAAFLATVSVESSRLSKTTEDLYYKDPARLASIYPRAFKSPAEAAPYVKNSKGLGDKLYQGYFGRGLIQLTWKDNYQRATRALGVDYVREPELVAEPEHAALTAAWFWSAAGCNEAADLGDMNKVTLLVNGPRRLHLAERTELFHANIEWMVV